MSFSDPSFTQSVDELSESEFEIFHLIGKGMRPKAITKKLFISPNELCRISGSSSNVISAFNLMKNYAQSL